jgi:hypothetical protein
VSWFRVDDKSAFHAKVVNVGNAAWGALCRMGAWASDHRTDGLLDVCLAKLIATEDEIARLIAEGFLEKAGEKSYRIHDFLDWNPSAASLESLSKKRSRAGKQGGFNSRASRQAIASTSALPSAEANGHQRVGPGSGIGISEGESEREPDETPRRNRNENSDGAMGYAVRGWQESCDVKTRLSVGELNKLLDAFDAHVGNEDKEAFARRTGTAFKKYSAGRPANVWKYAEWLDAKQPAERSAGQPRPEVDGSKSPARRPPPPIRNAVPRGVANG